MKAKYDRIQKDIAKQKMFIRVSNFFFQIAGNSIDCDYTL